MKEQNFKFRKSFGKLVEQMTDKQAGEFTKAVCGYVFLHKPMESKDEFLKGVFVYVKDALDTEMRDRENGKLGGAIVAEKYKEMRSRVLTEESVSESNFVSQLIVVASGGNDDAADKSESAMFDKDVTQKKKRGRPKTVNTINKAVGANENEGGGKAV